MWWIEVPILLTLMFTLGFLASTLTRKPTGPERRHEDRRSGVERRSPNPTPVQLDMRKGDRRQTDRRKKKSAWPSVTVVISAVLLTLIGTVTFAETRVESIFAEKQPSLLDSGWAKCDVPITWSMDTSRLTPSQARIAKNQMTADFAKWGKASGLTFQYAGEVPIQYNDSNYQVTSTVHPSGRHIYIGFLPDSASSLLDKRTVGFSMPTKVLPGAKEITEGTIIFEIDYVVKANRFHQSTLYLHEMGHALGLGHGTEKQDTMYYIVDTNNELSPADIAGIKALTKICNASPTS